MGLLQVLGEGAGLDGGETVGGEVPQRGTEHYDHWAQFGERVGHVERVRHSGERVEREEGWEGGAGYGVFVFGAEGGEREVQGEAGAAGREGAEGGERAWRCAEVAWVAVQRTRAGCGDEYGGGFAVELLARWGGIGVGPIALAISEPWWWCSMRS